jgi:lysyl-tRNA synthetase class 1
MSSSKGLGLKAHDLVKILPPQVARFLFARNGIKSQTNFDPNDKNAIPTLFDDYKHAADEYKKDPKSDLGRAFLLSQVGKIKMPPNIKFHLLVQYVQSPNMFEEINRLQAQEWAKYAKIWIEKFAPEENRFMISKEIPDVAKKLSKEQKKYLKKIASNLRTNFDEEEFQRKLYEWSQEMGIPSAKAFQAIYLSLFGKSYGPKAGYIILANKELVKKRFNEL